jgi:hypothetical protein
MKIPIFIGILFYVSYLMASAVQDPRTVLLEKLLTDAKDVHVAFRAAIATSRPPDALCIRVVEANIALQCAVLEEKPSKYSDLDNLAIDRIRDAFFARPSTPRSAPILEAFYSEGVMTLQAIAAFRAKK